MALKRRADEIRPILKRENFRRGVGAMESREDRADLAWRLVVGEIDSAGDVSIPFAPCWPKGVCEEWTVLADCPSV